MSCVRPKHNNRSEMQDWPEYVTSSSSPALCLDLVNTLSWRGGSPEESLKDISDLLRWCVESGVLDEAAADRVQVWAECEPDRAARLLIAARELRENIYRLFQGAAAGHGLPAAELVLFNRILRRAPYRSSLDLSGEKAGWRLRLRPEAESLLAPVLWSAGDLLVNLPGIRIRQCANPQCLWMFIDDSKNGSRRWCSMQYCGNRAKARRHYIRRKIHSPPSSA